MKIWNSMKLWWLVRVQAWEVAKLEAALQACKDTLEILQHESIKRGDQHVRQEWAATYRMNEAWCMGLRKRCIERQHRIDQIMFALGDIDPIEFAKRAIELSDSRPRREYYH